MSLYLTSVVHTYICIGVFVSISFTRYATLCMCFHVLLGFTANLNITNQLPCPLHLVALTNPITEWLILCQSKSTQECSKRSSKHAPRVMPALHAEGGSGGFMPLPTPTMCILDAAISTFLEDIYGTRCCHLISKMIGHT